MFHQNKINLVCLIGTLLAYMMVIVFVRSITTLIILEVLFFIMTCKEEKTLYFLYYLLASVSIILGYIIGNIILIKIVMLIEYADYFLNGKKMPIIFDKILKGRKKIDISENEYYRFKEEYDKEYFGYITWHFLILFLSIMVG